MWFSQSKADLNKMPTPSIKIIRNFRLISKKTGELSNVVFNWHLQAGKLQQI